MSLASETAREYWVINSTWHLCKVRTVMLTKELIRTGSQIDRVKDGQREALTTPNTWAVHEQCMIMSRITFLECMWPHLLSPVPKEFAHLYYKDENLYSVSAIILDTPSQRKFSGFLFFNSPVLSRVFYISLISLFPKITFNRVYTLSCFLLQKLKLLIFSKNQQTWRLQHRSVVVTLNLTYIWVIHYCAMKLRPLKTLLQYQILFLM